MRRSKEVKESVLGTAGRYQEIQENLHVKEVEVDGRRYIICFNPKEAARDQKTVVTGYRLAPSRLSMK